jgi:general secretion pathway protein D
MVFLHPVVVRDAKATDELSMDRYDLMRSGQKNNQPQPSSMVPINEAPQLPQLLSKPGKQNLLGTDSLPEPAAK